VLVHSKPLTTLLLLLAAAAAALLLLAPASRMVVVKGRPDSVQRATAMVKDLISGEPGTASQIIAKVRGSCTCYCLSALV
jgi:hypothetical protein